MKRMGWWLVDQLVLVAINVVSVLIAMWFFIEDKLYGKEDSK